ncbi:hypothetical protein D3C71_1781990 [compost metagenome]
MLLNYFRQHQFRSSAGILFHAAFEEVRPTLLLFQMLVTLLQHRQGFAHQFFILIQYAL